MSSNLNLVHKSFKENTRRRINRDKTVVYFECKKGFWGVSGPLKHEKRVNREAFYYFMQYYSDGEYEKDPEKKAKIVLDKMAKARKEFGKF